MAVPSSVPRIRTDLAYYGVVTRVINATQFVVAGLAGMGDGALVGYAAYVMAKANGTVTPPHTEQPAVTAYVSASGTFTHTGYTVPLAVGDQLLLLHPNISTNLIVGIAALVALTLSIGPAATSILGNIYNILGNPAVAISTSIATILADMNIPGLNSADNALLRDVVGNKTDTAIIVSDLVSSLMRYAKGNLNQAAAILADTAALLTLTETSGTLASTGGEDTVVLVGPGALAINPRVVTINLDNMVGGDTVVIKAYKRILAAGNLELFDYQSYTGADGGLLNGVKLIDVALPPNRFGFWVTLTKAGAARNFDWEYIYEG